MTTAKWTSIQGRLQGVRGGDALNTYWTFIYKRNSANFAPQLKLLMIFKGKFYFHTFFG
jgi:hypothetical protein